MKIIPIFFYHEKWVVIMRKFVYSPDGVEKMGPLRGDGNLASDSRRKGRLVEKMGPLRGDGNPPRSVMFVLCFNCREDGSPSWGRKRRQFLC